MWSHCVCVSVISVTITHTHTEVCLIGSVVYIHSQGQRLSVCMAVQHNVHCGGAGVCDLTSTTHNIHALSASHSLIGHLSLISFVC